MLLNHRALLTMSSGLFAGLGTTLTFVGVPSILASSDPLPAWKKAYTNGAKIAVSLLLVSTGSGISCYLKTEDWRYLLVSGMSFVVIPYTLLAMRPTNNTLMAMRNGEGAENDRRVRELISKWDKLQCVRTLLGVGAFFTTIIIIHKRL